VRHVADRAWFERLYRAAEGGGEPVPWDRGAPHYLESFAGDGLELVELGDLRDADAHRWRAELRRQPSA